MFQKKFRYMAAVLAALMITQGSFTAFADEIGPGYDEQNKASTDTSVTDPANAWKKVNGVYVDNNGKTIEGALLRGISVAKWQGDIDWAKVAADDISFAFIKMMSYGYEGGYTMDPNYEKNMKGALDNGVQAAPYVYLQTKTVEEAKAAAKYAVEKVSGYNVKYPIAVDVESKYILELSVQELTDVVNAFCVRSLRQATHRSSTVTTANLRPRWTQSRSTMISGLRDTARTVHTKAARSGSVRIRDM